MSHLIYSQNIVFVFPEEIVDESMEEEKVCIPKAKKPILSVMKKTKTNPDKTIRRKQLKAKSKAISDQIKKRKQFKKKKPGKS